MARRDPPHRSGWAKHAVDDVPDDVQVLRSEANARVRSAAGRAAVALATTPRR